MKLRRLALALLAGLALPFAVPALAQQDHSVTVGPGSTYDPASLSIAVGDEVTWTNVGGGTHNVRFADGSFEDPPQPSASSWSVSRTFDRDATLVYYCELHGGPTFGMRGTIVVGDGGPTTGPTGPTPTNPGGTNTPPTNTTPTDTTGTPGDPGGDATQPAISELDPVARRFCRRRSRTCRRPGMRFSLELSEPATLEGIVTRTGKARRAARRRRFTRSGRQGRNRIRVSARGLARGRYRLRLRARDAAGNVSAYERARFVLR